MVIWFRCVQKSIGYCRSLEYQTVVRSNSLGSLTLSNLNQKLQPPQVAIDHVIGLYNHGQLEQTVSLAESLAKQYPKAMILYQILGAAYIGLKNTDKTIASYQKVLRLNPNHTDAHNNMGMALYDQGRFDEAVESYQKAVKLEPDFADAHYNLGNALKQTGDLKQAIESYRVSLTINPNDAEVLVNYGNALKDYGNFDQAIEVYTKTLKIEPNFTSAKTNMENALEKKTEIEKLVKDYAWAAKLEIGSAKIFSFTGTILEAGGYLDAAIDNYTKALKIKPDYAEAYLNMGAVLKLKGELSRAIESYQAALRLEPDLTLAYYNIGHALKDIRFSQPSPELSKFIVKLLEKITYVRPSDIAPATISLIKSSKAFKSVLNKYLFGNLEQTILELSEIPLLLKLMELCPIIDLEIERVLIYLRSEILNNVCHLSGTKEIIAFQNALALQCFTNEYIYNQTDEEKKKINDLENSIEKNLADGRQPIPVVLACLASFKALHHYSWCNLLSFQDDLKQVEKRQISEIKKEILLRSEMPILTEVMDDVSSKVRQQYEKNPYPRWVNMGLPREARTIKEAMQPLNLKIKVEKIFDCDVPQVLVAGCGTGQHPIGTAARFKNCNVLAIDLSLSSLAYAKRKTEELGFTNIKYMQADILDLGKLGRKFDIIESVGVLHHMDEPMVGWKLLTESLESGGLMNIGLYSEYARQNIVKIREEIKQKNVGDSDFEMKSFRSHLSNSKQSHHRRETLSPDFYSLSNFRDLLFHVQEHRFTLPQIKNSLAELGLEFCGFTDSDLTGFFKLTNTGLEDLWNIEKWNSFEKENPESFGGMYQFWCQKVV